MFVHVSVPSEPSFSSHVKGKTVPVQGANPQRLETVALHYRIRNQFLKQFKIDHCAFKDFWSRRTGPAGRGDTATLIVNGRRGWKWGPYSDVGP
jgi:hypothetical protein